MRAANPYIPDVRGLFGLGTLGDDSSSDPTDYGIDPSLLEVTLPDVSGAYAANQAAITSQVMSDLAASSSTPASSSSSSSSSSSPSSSAFSLDSILGDVTKIASAGASVYQQTQLQSINAARLKAGLPPISASAIAPTVNVGLSPQTQQLVMYGGIALLLVLVMGEGRHR